MRKVSLQWRNTLRIPQLTYYAWISRKLMLVMKTANHVQNFWRELSYEEEIFKRWEKNIPSVWRKLGCVNISFFNFLMRERNWMSFLKNSWHCRKKKGTSLIWCKSHEITGPKKVWRKEKSWELESKWVTGCFSGWSGCETMYLRLGLEPTCWDSNPAKTLIGTWTHEAGTQTRPKPTVFQLRSHTWFQDLMKLTFLMSHEERIQWETKW